MNYTEEQKVERVKNALFTEYQSLVSLFGEKHLHPQLTKSFLKINYNLLQLSCLAQKKDLEAYFDEELCNSLFDISMMLQLFEKVNESLKEPIK